MKALRTNINPALSTRLTNGWRHGKPWSTVTLPGLKLWNKKVRCSITNKHTFHFHLHQSCVTPASTHPSCGQPAVANSRPVSSHTLLTEISICSKAVLNDTITTLTLRHVMRLVQLCNNHFTCGWPRHACCQKSTWQGNNSWCATTPWVAPHLLLKILHRGCTKSSTPCALTAEVSRRWHTGGEKLAKATSAMAPGRTGRGTTQMWWRN